MNNKRDKSKQTLINNLKTICTRELTKQVIDLGLEIVQRYVYHKNYFQQEIYLTRCYKASENTIHEFLAASLNKR